MLKNKATYQTQLILYATCFAITLIASAKDVPAGKQNMSDSCCTYYNSITNSSTAVVRTVWIQIYSDTSANEDNSFRNHIRQPKRDFPQVSIENRLIRSGCCPLFKDKFYKIVKSTL